MQKLALSGSAMALALAATPAQADTLQEALTKAYVNNPTLEAARANQRANDENVQIQRSQGLPSVSGTGVLTEFIEQNSTNFFTPDRIFVGGIDLGVPVYSGGAVRNGIKASKERVEAGRADLRGTESAIFSQVVAAYMDILRGQALVSLSSNQVDVLSVNVEATSDRFEIGDVTRTDVAQSQSRLALAQGDLRNAEAILISARERYIALTGDMPQDLQPPPPLPGLPDNPAAAVDVALENNPDLIAARERAEAAGYDIEVAGSSRLPTVSLFAGYDYQNALGSIPDIPADPTVPGSTPTPVDQSATGAQAGVSLRIPLFQGGRPAALQRQATARAQAALEQVIATERDVIAQTRAAYSSWQASLAIIQSSQSAVEAAALSLEGVRAENSIGNRTILDVLNAEQELLSSRVQLVTARRNAYVAGFSLLAAMGRAEARDLGLGDEGVLYDPLDNYERVGGSVWDWGRDPAPAATTSRTVDISAQDANIPEIEEPGVTP